MKPTIRSSVIIPNPELVLPPLFADILHIASTPLGKVVLDPRFDSLIDSPPVPLTGRVIIDIPEDQLQHVDTIDVIFSGKESLFHPCKIFGERRLIRELMPLYRSSDALRVLRRQQRYQQSQQSHSSSDKSHAVTQATLSSTGQPSIATTSGDGVIPNNSTTTTAAVTGVAAGTTSSMQSGPMPISSASAYATAASLTSAQHHLTTSASLPTPLSQEVDPDGNREDLASYTINPRGFNSRSSSFDTIGNRIAPQGRSDSAEVSVPCSRAESDVSIPQLETFQNLLIPHAGRNSYDFSLAVPVDIVPSLNTKYASIKYYVKLVIVSKRLGVLTKTREIIVRRTYPALPAKSKAVDSSPKKNNGTASAKAKGVASFNSVKQKKNGINNNPDRTGKKFPSSSSMPTLSSIGSPGITIKDSLDVGNRTSMESISFRAIPASIANERIITNDVGTPSEESSSPYEGLSQDDISSPEYAVGGKQTIDDDQDGSASEPGSSWKNSLKKTAKSQISHLKVTRTKALSSLRNAFVSKAMMQDLPSNDDDAEFVNNEKSKARRVSLISVSGAGNEQQLTDRDVTRSTDSTSQSASQAVVPSGSDDKHIPIPISDYSNTSQVGYTSYGSYASSVRSTAPIDPQNASQSNSEMQLSLHDNTNSDVLRTTRRGSYAEESMYSESTGSALLNGRKTDYGSNEVVNDETQRRRLTRSNSWSSLDSNNANQRSTGNNVGSGGGRARIGGQPSGDIQHSIESESFVTGVACDCDQCHNGGPPSLDETASGKLFVNRVTESFECATASDEFSCKVILPRPILCNDLEVKVVVYIHGIKESIGSMRKVICDLMERKVYTGVDVYFPVVDSVHDDTNLSEPSVKYKMSPQQFVGKHLKLMFSLSFKRALPDVKATSISISHFLRLALYYEPGGTTETGRQEDATSSVLPWKNVSKKRRKYCVFEIPADLRDCVIDDNDSIHYPSATIIHNKATVEPFTHIPPDLASLHSSKDGGLESKPRSLNTGQSESSSRSRSRLRESSRFTDTEAVDFNGEIRLNGGSRGRINSTPSIHLLRTNGISDNSEAIVYSSEPPSYSVFDEKQQLSNSDGDSNTGTSSPSPETRNPPEGGVDN